MGLARRARVDAVSDIGTHAGNAKVTLIDAAGVRHFKATTGADGATAGKSDQTFELAAGASIVVHYRSGTTGTPTSLAPTAAEVAVLEDNSGTVVRTFAAADPNVDEDFTFVATSTGAAGGANRRGTYRLRVQASRISQPGLATDWRVNSDNTSTLLAAGQSTDWGRGYLRAGDALVTFGFSDAALGGAAPPSGRFVYPKSQFFRATMGAAEIANSSTKQITLRQRQGGTDKSTDAGTMAAGVLDVTRAGGVGAASGVNNDFTAADTGTALRLTFAASTLSGRAWSHMTSVPAGWSGTPGSLGGGFEQADSPAALYTIDPRVSFTQLLQLNDAAFGSPPSSKNAPGGQRLVSDLGFVAARATDAHSAGINGLAWTEKLWDSGQLTGSEATPTKTRATLAQTQGGQAGWSDGFLTWDSQLPSGSWTQKEVITTSKATGLELGNTRTLTLLAPNPNFAAVVQAGPSSASAEVDHWHAGEPMLVAFTIIDLDTRRLSTVDVSPAPAVMFLRFNQSSARIQFLDASHAWVDASAAAAVEHTMTASPSDPRAFERTFTAEQTATWGEIDIMWIIARAYIGGTPYYARSTRESVGKFNAHSGYALDALGLALTGKLTQR